MSRHKISTLLSEVGLVILLAMTVYLMVSMLTYSPNDPGPTHSGSGGEILNLGGRIGAWITDLLFFLFGRAAYLLILLFIAIGWQSYYLHTRQRSFSHPLLMPLGVAFALFGACGLEQIYFALADGHPLKAGGMLGHNSWYLTQNFGLIGATVILLALLIIGITLAVKLSWLRLMDQVGYSIFAFFGWASEQIEKQIDYSKGVQARKKRNVNAKQINMELSEKKPPEIAPRVQGTPESNRKKQERQIDLLPEVDEGDPLPQLSILDPPPKVNAGYSRDELETMSRLLVKKLKDFSIDVDIQAVQPGPVVTRFEAEPAAGVRASKITTLARDLARSLSVESVRVVDNIPGKTTIGIEVPNQTREVVRLIEGLSSREYEKSSSPLTLVLGKDIAGNPVITDLERMPHLLIAGTTGSGKSVCVNALILSMLYKSTHEQVRFIMVDPKFLELPIYNDVPHLLVPVVTDMTKAANALRWCISEMDRRFHVMALVNVRNITAYNKKVVDSIASGEPLTSSGSAGGDPTELLKTMPYIVVIIDELADLLMVVGKTIEAIIIRIAQRARAAGIHLVLATQRPSVDVITGLIKANVPTRIAFQVSSRADSRTVIDQMGAEQLLGHGDMLFLAPGGGAMKRVHGSFISDQEIENVVAYLKTKPHPGYLHSITDEDNEGVIGDNGGFASNDGEADELYDEAVKFVITSRRASISAVQRMLRVGYNRAARMIETMEESGVVSPSENGKREVLVPPPPEA